MTWEPETLDEARHAVLGTLDYDAETARHVDAVVAKLKGAPPGVVLDWGCGIGRLTVPVSARTGRVVVGYDPSEPMLALAPMTPRTRYVLAPPQVPGSFAAVFSVLTFQHLRDEQVWGALRAIADLLVPGGVFVVQFSVGETRERLCWERDPATMLVWQSAVGLVVQSEGPDTVWPTWWWQKARKT